MKTEKQIRALLPIGSVVMLHNGKKPVMIYGIYQTDNESGKEYDYISVVWPEGSMGTGTSFMFNAEDVDKLLFRGAEGVARDQFLDKLVSYYTSQDGK